MANEPLALAIRPPDAPDEDDFQALCAALSASGRGRAFLAEYARRNRQANTEALLEAIGRVEARLQADASAVQRMREDLRLLLIAVRLARPEIDAVGPAARAAKLSKLLDLLERRLDLMAGAESAAALTNDSGEAARSHLSVVPPPDQPELPIPSRASAPVAAIVLLHDREKREPVLEQDHGQTNVAPVAEAVPAAAVVESALPAMGVVETVIPPDPLAAIMALSDDERLALFT